MSVFQHAFLLPVLAVHFRFHKCLDVLEERIKYKFKDRSLLQVGVSPWKQFTGEPHCYGLGKQNEEVTVLLNGRMLGSQSSLGSNHPCQCLGIYVLSTMPQIYKKIQLNQHIYMPIKYTLQCVYPIFPCPNDLLMLHFVAFRF